ncbi:MAG: DMT family transporter [Roseobacter sp.]
MSNHPQITASSWLMIAILGLTWGGTFLVIEIALEGITPFWLAAGRIAFAAALMTCIWGLLGFRLFKAAPSPGAIFAILNIGALSSAVPFILLAWGQQFVTAGFAGVSMAAVALLVLPLSHFLIPGDQLTWRKSVGFILGFVGVCVLIGGQAFDTTGAGLETAGRIACLGAAACYAISSVTMRRLPEVDTIGLSTILLLIGAIIVLPAAYIAEGPPPMPNAKTLWVLAFLGLVPTAAANLLRVQVVRTAGPVFMSLVNYQVPVWSVLLGALVLSEPLPSSLLLAMTLILSGVGLSQYGAITQLFRRR